MLPRFDLIVFSSVEASPVPDEQQQKETRNSQQNKRKHGEDLDEDVDEEESSGDEFQE